jgi:hypothetical protein
MAALRGDISFRYLKHFKQFFLVKTKVILSQAYVTLADFGYPV